MSQETEIEATEYEIIELNFNDGIDETIEYTEIETLETDNEDGDNTDNIDLKNKSRLININKTIKDIEQVNENLRKGSSKIIKIKSYPTEEINKHFRFTKNLSSSNIIDQNIKEDKVFGEKYMKVRKIRGPNVNKFCNYFQCNLCNDKFSKNNLLIKHKNEVHKKFQCEKCAKNFFYKYSYRKHMKLHAYKETGILDL